MPFWSASLLASPSAAPLALGLRATISLVGGVFLAAGLVLIAVTILVAVSSVRFHTRALQATGTIVARQMANSSSYSDSGPTYYSIVEFTTEDGTLTRGRSRVASNPPAGKIGAVVPIFYDPADPSRVDIDNGRTRVMSGCAITITTVIGVAFLLFGMIILEIGLNS